MNSDGGFVRSEPICSPLDPFLIQFLRAVQALPREYVPASDRRAIAHTLDWPLDFVDAILVSAQARGLLERVLTGQGRRRVMWTVSTRGRIWLDLVSAPPALAPTHVTSPLAAV